MSNFQDNFHREEEKLLDYDDSAFYYFFVSILTVALIPLTYHILKTMIFGEKKFDVVGKNCECDRCKEILKKRQQFYKNTWIKPSFFFKLGFALFLWFLWYLTADQISKIKPLKSFDPYQILGVDVGSDTATVKRAYRKLSLIKHPDKNPDDPLAVSEFIQITKAYTTLTDDTARENWEKYGNPDGPGSFQVAIALPRFLLQKEYNVSVLACFFVVLLIIIPGFFYYNLEASNKDIGDVDVENRKIFAFLLNENLIYKNCPTVLCCSLEFQRMAVKNEKEKTILNAIKTDENVKELIPNKMPPQIPLNQKALCVTLAYMLRMDELKELGDEDIELILSKAPYIMEQMLQMAMLLAMEFKFGRSRKRITAKNVLTLITFSQNLIQGMWQDDDAFLQIPGMTYDIYKDFRKKNKNLTLEQYCMMTTEQRKAINMFDNPKLFEESEKAIGCFPLIEVDLQYYVEGEKEIAVGDILTIKLSITHKSLGDNDSLGFIHSNKFPFLKQSSWFLVFTDAEETDFMAMEKLVIKEKVHVKLIKERLGRPGRMQFFMILRNDSYRGFDKKISVMIDVLKEVQRAPIEYDEEDIQAQKAPSMMQQMMEMAPQDDSDEEVSEDEQTAATDKNSPAAAAPAGTAPQEQQPETESKKDK